MVKTINILILMAGTIFASGQVSSTQYLNASGHTLNPEYPEFKRNAEQQIADNDKSVADLRMKTNRHDDTPMDDVRTQKINDLEKRNGDLRKRLFGYEKLNTDWVVFKRDFTHDMHNLQSAFHDFGSDLNK